MKFVICWGSFGRRGNLKKGKNVVEFTPDDVGTVRWSCWMCIIPGVFIVTDDGVASTTQLNDAATATAFGGELWWRFDLWGMKINRVRMIR